MVWFDHVCDCLSFDRSYHNIMMLFGEYVIPVVYIFEQVLMTATSSDFFCVPKSTLCCKVWRKVNDQYLTFCLTSYLTGPWASFSRPGLYHGQCSERHCCCYDFRVESIIFRRFGNKLIAFSTYPATTSLSAHRKHHYSTMFSDSH